MLPIVREPQSSVLLYNQLHFPARDIAAEEEKIRRDAVTLQLGITYKEMSLSVKAADDALNLSSGDRAPDATGLDGKGRPVRLFDFFRGPHFTLLRLCSAGNDASEVRLPAVKCVDVMRELPAKTPAAEVFVDADKHVATAYGGLNGEYVLVRPDGYVGGWH